MVGKLAIKKKNSYKVVRGCIVLIVVMMFAMGIVSLLVWLDVKQYLSNETDDFQSQNLRGIDSLSQKIIDKQIEEGLDGFDPNQENGEAQIDPSIQPGRTEEPQKLEYDTKETIVDGSKVYNVTFDVLFSGSSKDVANSGRMVFEIHPEWAPIGSKRFLELVESKYFDNTRFFRVIKVSE